MVVVSRQAMMDAVTIPVIASSGAGSAEHFSEVFQVTGVQAVSLRGTGEGRTGAKGEEIRIQGTREKRAGTRENENGVGGTGKDKGKGNIK